MSTWHQAHSTPRLGVRPLTQIKSLKDLDCVLTGTSGANRLNSLTQFASTDKGHTTRNGPCALLFIKWHMKDIVWMVCVDVKRSILAMVSETNPKTRSKEHLAETHFVR